MLGYDGLGLDNATVAYCDVCGDHPAYCPDTRDLYCQQFDCRNLLTECWCDDTAGGKHRLATDWANREHVVYLDNDGAIVRSEYARNRVIGYAGFPVTVGDTFPV